MKKYIKPETKTYQINAAAMLAASQGVSTGNIVGDEYSDGDVTYTKEDAWYD